MTTDPLKQFGAQLDSDIEVPKGLAHKIMESVETESKQIEKKRILHSGLKLALALGLMIYGLSAVIVNLMNSQISLYIEMLFKDPELFFSSPGFRAFTERLPLLSLFTFAVAAIYSVRHLAIRNLQKYPTVFATVTTSLALVVTLSAFVGGMAVGVNSNEDFQSFAGESLLQPISENTPFDYSSVGTVLSTERSIFDDSLIINISNEKGLEQSVKVSADVLEQSLNGTELEEGVELLIVGAPTDHGPVLMDASTSLDKEEDLKAPPAIQADFIKLLPQN